MTDFRALLELLAAAGVEFVLVGGLAATAHGSARLTRDIDIVYNRTAENIERLVRALAPHQPYVRGAPPGLPFKLDARTIRHGLNFTLTTVLGDIDLLGEVAGGGAYPALLEHASPIEMFGVSLLCVDLSKLIELKRAAGRPKDFEVLAELELLLDLKPRGEK